MNKTLPKTLGMIATCARVLDTARQYPAADALTTVMERVAQQANWWSNGILADHLSANATDPATVKKTMSEQLGNLLETIKNAPIDPSAKESGADGTPNADARKLLISMAEEAYRSLYNFNIAKTPAAAPAAPGAAAPGGAGQPAAPNMADLTKYVGFTPAAASGRGMVRVATPLSGIAGNAQAALTMCNFWLNKPDLFPDNASQLAEYIQSRLQAIISYSNGQTNNADLMNARSSQVTPPATTGTPAAAGGTGTPAAPGTPTNATGIPGGTAPASGTPAATGAAPAASAAATPAPNTAGMTDAQRAQAEVAAKTDKPGSSTPGNAAPATPGMPATQQSQQALQEANKLYQSRDSANPGYDSIIQQWLQYGQSVGKDQLYTAMYNNSNLHSTGIIQKVMESWNTQHASDPTQVMQMA